MQGQLFRHRTLLGKDARGCASSQKQRSRSCLRHSTNNVMLAHYSSSQIIRNSFHQRRDLVCEANGREGEFEGTHRKLHKGHTWWNNAAIFATMVGAFAISSCAPAHASRVENDSSPRLGESLKAPWMDISEASGSSGNKQKQMTRAMSPEEIDAETRAAVARSSDERLLKQMKRANHKSKGGKLVRDPFRSRVMDPNSIPSNKEIEKMALQSAWRLDKLKDMTYTQFWNLVSEGHIESIRYTADRRSVLVKTRASAPGGARVEKVGLPYDPELFDHLVQHG